MLTLDQTGDEDYFVTMKTDRDKIHVKAIVGTVEGKTFTMDNEGMVFVYTK